MEKTSTEADIASISCDDIDRGIAMLNLKVVSWSLGISAAISFVLCVIYGLIAPSMHSAQALEAVLPAFKWLTVSGFMLGLVESFLYGAYAGLVFVPIHNALTRRWASAPGQDTR